MVLNLRRQLPAVPEMLSERLFLKTIFLNHHQLPNNYFQEQLKRQKTLAMEGSVFSEEVNSLSFMRKEWEKKGSSPVLPAELWNTLGWNRPLEVIYPYCPASKIWFLGSRFS